MLNILFKSRNEFKCITYDDKSFLIERAHHISAPHHTERLYMQQGWYNEKGHRKEKHITFDTDIMFVVRVPVLSLQITVVHPNVSTEGRDLTIAFKRAILLVPRAKHLKEKQADTLWGLHQWGIRAYLDTSTNMIQSLHLNKLLTGNSRCYHSWKTFWNGCNSKSDGYLSKEKQQKGHPLRNSIITQFSSM
jgi:hypothetical protein